MIFQFRISGPGGGEWYTHCEGQQMSGRCRHTRKTHHHHHDVGRGFPGPHHEKLNAMKAYTSGKLKIEGDLMKSQLIEKLFKF